MKQAPVRRPTPEPVETDEVRVVAIGTAGWLVTLVVLLPFAGRLREDGRGSWLWICLVGIGLGLVGLFYTRRRRLASRAGRTARHDQTYGPAQLPPP